ncbi:MAG: hypothetical protein ACK2U2_03325 [Anaerolineae bacterium]|jgi:hypothetical protein
MKRENKPRWIAVRAVVAASCLCAAAAGCYRALTRISYLTLAPAAPAARQAAST